MTKPENFILNSDYASLKNDAKGTLSVAITDTGILPDGTSRTFESFLDVGTVNAGTRGQLYSSLSPTIIWCGLGISVPVTVTVYISGTPVDVFTYNLPVILERVSPTRIRLYAIFYSYGGGVDMRITGGYQTITANVVTFLSPFN